MANFIEGPLIGPGSVNPSLLSGAPGGAKEIVYDSSAQRAQYLEQVSIGDQGFATAVPDAGNAGGESLDEEIMRAAASGQPLTAEMMARLPSPLTPPPLALTNGFQPPRVYGAPSISPAGGMVGLTVRVGKGIVANVTFQGGEPRAKHWARLLRFIEIEAESDDDGDGAEDGAAGAVGLGAAGAGESGVPRRVERRKRKDVGGAAKSGELAGDPAGSA